MVGYKWGMGWERMGGKNEECVWEGGDNSVRESLLGGRQ